MKCGPIGILGIPLDFNSSFLRGTAAAPGAIKSQFHAPSTNYFALNGLDLQNHPGYADLGDLNLTQDAGAFAQIELAITQILEKGGRVLSLGGDHSITFPIVKAFSKFYPKLNILHLDAHPDLYDELEGNRFSHASPFARIMEAGHAARLVQVGIRCMTKHQREQVNRFGVECHELHHWDFTMDFRFEGPVYISFDLDALDPAFAPGVAHHEPGGLTTREVLAILHAVKAPIVGADIVELNPARDINGMTAMVAAKMMKELLACMLGS